MHTRGYGCIVQSDELGPRCALPGSRDLGSRRERRMTKSVLFVRICDVSHRYIACITIGYPILDFVIDWDERNVYIIRAWDNREERKDRQRFVHESDREKG